MMTSSPSTKLIGNNASKTIVGDASTIWGVLTLILSLINCDRWAAYVTAEITGSRKALDFISDRLDLFRIRLGPFKDEEEFEATMHSLISARDVLIEHGPKVDRELGFVSMSDDTAHP